MLSSRFTRDDHVSRWSVLAAISGCGVLLFVALPLAVSSPYPTPKEKEWISSDAGALQLSMRVPMGHNLDRAIDRAEAKPPTPEPVLEPAEADDAPEPVEAESAPEPAETASAPLQYASADPAEPPAVANLAAVAPDTSADPEATGSIGPAMPAPRRPADIMEEVDDYLWDVYRRAPVKRDSSGDFTWKDPAAAKRLGMSLKAYVIGGMDRDFREQLYHAGRAMDAAGLHWSMLSAFRDDYRQKLASGFKASAGNSLHGGSRRTGGYGHGRAIDITSADDEGEAVWRWIDRHGAQYGLSRPMPGADPAHIQARGDWQRVAAALRKTRAARVQWAQDTRPPDAHGGSRSAR